MWIKIDDSYFTHRKIVQLTGPAILMDLTGIAYCARELTDGFVAEGAILLVAALAKVPEPEKHVGELVRVGRWEKRDGGFFIHDYLDYQPSREDVIQSREIKKARSDLRSDRFLAPSIKKRDCGLCRYCGVEVNWSDRRGPQGGTYDHVNPRGGNDYENIVVACRSCNSRKGRRTPAEANMVLLPAVTGNLLVTNRETTGLPASRIPYPVSRALFPEPETPSGNGLPTAPRKRQRGNGSVTAPTWESYREAYIRAYHTEPVRNAKVNGQIAQLLQRIGVEDSPPLAAWFLSHRGAWYVQQGHCVGALLRDCEKLHTEWLNGATLHRRDVDEIDRTSADQAMWKRIEEQHAARKAGEA